MAYQAPIKEILFTMQSLTVLEALSKTEQFKDISLETAAVILEEFSKLTAQVIEPLNVVGDQQGAQLIDGKVFSAPGFKEAFQQYIKAGWLSLQHPHAYGGQGFPKIIASACSEILSASNMSFALCPLLTDGAIEAILTAGSEQQKAWFVPQLLSGNWTGTMNLTEPQAGSDLALIKTRAEPQSEGHYLLFGTKIFITWGEHDMADNIIHLVLARLPDAPEGIAGISLFIVPKYLGDAPQRIKNDVQCISLEHKLGIHASPTAVMQFGDQTGAVGYLVGKANQGLQYMFVMMNASRFAVGLQGIGLSERAYQKARQYALERVQSRPVDRSSQKAVTIIHHPDVKRMLSTMRALTESTRALAYFAASYYDLAQIQEGEESDQSRKKYEYLVPIVKAWGTECANEVANLSIQVFGGMGYIEETGAAQDYRDARILTIYEGTTAIQANDLLGRKTVRNQGEMAHYFAEQMEHTLQQLLAMTDEESLVIAQQLQAAVQAYRDVTVWILAHHTQDPNGVYMGSVLYLRLSGMTLCGWMLAKMFLSAKALYKDDPEFYQSKIALAHFYAINILPQTQALKTTIMNTFGDKGISALKVTQL